MKTLNKILFLALFALALTACREQSTAEKMEDAVEDVADEVEDTAEDITE